MLVGLTAFLRYTRYGLIIRAGVENRAMVTALGIDVRRRSRSSSPSAALRRARRRALGVYYGVIDPGRALRF